MTREKLAYYLIKVLNPSPEEAPELYTSKGAMLRVYQARRWPKVKLHLLAVELTTRRSMREIDIEPVGCRVPRPSLFREACSSPRLCKRESSSELHTLHSDRFPK